jgi:hypothetical protein
MEQCMRTKFGVKIAKGAKETYTMLKFSFGEDPLSHTINLSVLLDLKRAKFLPLSPHTMKTILVHVCDKIPLS